jgi:phosphatidylglycerophosphatase A
MRFDKKEKMVVPHQVWRNPWHFIGFGFGTGLLPFMPGTFGSLVGIPFYLLLKHCHWAVYLIIVALLTVLGSWISQKVSRDIEIMDHPGVNFDEIVGMLVTLFLAPAGWIWIALGFGLFRLFDIWKPGIIGWIDHKYQSGFGMMLDDLVAGAAAFAVLQLIALLTHHSVFMNSSVTT